MRTLYHLWLSAPSRQIRIALAEKGLEFELKVERVWDRREAFLGLNPAGTVPVLVEEEGAVVVGRYAIAEYLEEVHPARSLLGKAPLDRAEVRRLLAWFDEKFAHEVTDNLVEEKVMKRFMGMGQPNSAAIRAGYANVHYHLEYVGYLAERRKYLAGDHFSFADIAAAAHLSCLDYIGDVPWEEHPRAKDWYVRIKSRPSFRPLLQDHIPGAPPPKHYADLDF